MREKINEVFAHFFLLGKKLADAYVRDRQTQEEVDTIHTKARRARRVGRYTNHERGTEVLLLEGSATDIDEIEMKIDTLADAFYRQDGGRDTEAAAHRRTRDQRRFDAAFAVFAERTPAGGSDAPDGPSPSPRDSAKRSTPTNKTVFVITASVDQALGRDNSPLVQADGRTLATSVVERLSCGAEFVGQVFGAKGEVLAQGRAVRQATFAQRLALIVRDGGCVRCGAGHMRCQVHHLTPWTSRLRGKTNVDEMALVCDDCHHHIHDNHLTLFQDDEAIWRLRRALPDERAAAHTPQRGSRRRPAAEMPDRSGKSPRSAPRSRVRQQTLIQQE